MYLCVAETGECRQRWDEQQARPGPCEALSQHTYNIYQQKPAANGNLENNCGF